MLQISECTCRYAAVQLGNGTGPAEARETALFVAQELNAMAAELTRLTRLSGPERRELARQLAGLGWSRRQIAIRLGVSNGTVYNYLRPR